MKGKMTLKEAEAWAKKNGVPVTAVPRLIPTAYTYANVVEANLKRREVLDWAKDHNFITNPDGYEYYIESWFMLKYCPCDKTRKNCPCPESVSEVKEDGYCKCRLYWRDYEIFKEKNLPI